MAVDMDKLCFVISPIGSDDSPQCQAADQLLKHVIIPASGSVGLEVQRADKIVDPGNISTQIIRYLMEAKVVVADMTGHNPNVFYELAVRHAAKKPVVHMILNGETIPFDVSHNRAIYYQMDLDGASAAKEALTSSMKAILSGEDEPDTPLSTALLQISLRESGNPESERFSSVLESLEEIGLRLRRIESQQRPGNVATMPLSFYQANPTRLEQDVLELIGYFEHFPLNYSSLDSVSHVKMRISSLELVIHSQIDRLEQIQGGLNPLKGNTEAEMAEMARELRESQKIHRIKSVDDG